MTIMESQRVLQPLASCGKADRRRPPRAVRALDHVAKGFRIDAELLRHELELAMTFGHVTDGAAHRELRIADRREDLMPGDRREIFMRLGGNRRARETTAFREAPLQQVFIARSEEHTSELQSLMR